MTKSLSWETIPYASDLMPDDLLIFIINASLYTFTEKLDGSNIQFGMDGNGFYTSRETRLGERKYSVDDYDINYSTTFQRFVHAAIESRLDRLVANGFAEGEHVIAEVLFGKQPNTIVYDDDNMVVLISAKNGDINKYADCLQNIKVKIDEIPFTSDGKTIEYTSEEKYIDFGVLRCRELWPERATDFLIEKLNKFLMHSPFPGTGISNHNLIYKSRSETGRSKAEHDSAFDEYIFLKDDIIDTVTRVYVDHIDSDFGPLGGSIEGIVIQDLNDGNSFKLLNRQFKHLNKANYELRDSLWGRARSTKLESPKSAYGTMLLEMAEAVGLPTLATTHSHTLFKKMGNSKNKVVELVKDYDIEYVQEEWCFIVEEWRLIVDEKLRTYQASADREDPLHERNMQTFSIVFTNMEKLLNDISNMSDHSDIIRLLVGDVAWSKR